MDRINRMKFIDSRVFGIQGYLFMASLPRPVGAVEGEFPLLPRRHPAGPIGPSQEIEIGESDAQARQPDARIEGVKQARDFIGIEERQIGRAHHLAESRDVEHRADARVQEDPEQDRPATGGPEPEPERQAYSISTAPCVIRLTMIG